jgi:CubicO group peptidase (beta-lactamase class C family)
MSGHTTSQSDLWTLDAHRIADMILLRALAIVAAAMLHTGAAIAQPAPPDAQARVDEIFKRWTPGTPGCAVGADVKGQPVIRSAYGLADLEHDVANRPDTIFESGSVAKQFTAMAVLLLARDGKLSLDEPVRTYISELPESAASVTVRQMLQHTGGLRDWGYVVAAAGWPRGSRVHTHEHVLDVLSRQQALNFDPGTNWSYSNSGYNLAAVLVSRLSGTSFAAFTKARIFDPLGMNDSSWRDDWTRVVKRRAVGHGERRGAFVTNMPFENVHGNGGMLTTIGDLLKWNANFDTPVVGDAALVAELQKPAVFNDGRSHEYAFGLYVDTYRGVREVDHSGGTAGYVAHLVRYPDERVSVAVLCNVNTAPATSYAKAVAALFLGDLKEPAAPAPTHVLTSEEAAALAGLYRAPLPIGVVRVEAGKDGLSIRGIGPLIPQSAKRFVTADRRVLEFNGQGGLRGADEFGTVTELQRVEPATPSVEALREFTGRFISEEAEATLEVAVESERLVIRRRPGMVTPLTPVYADAFTGNLGWVVFRRDGAGRIEALSLGQERLWDLRFSRLSAQPPRAPSSSR